MSMGRWASKKTRAEREEIIVRKHNEGLLGMEIAQHMGLKTGSVQNVLKKHGLVYRGVLYARRRKKRVA